MKAVIDTNILISALIKGSLTRKVLVESGWEFSYPEASLHEVRKHKDLILRKSGLSEAEYEQILSRLLKYVALVPAEQVYPRLEEARRLIGQRDAKDIIFLAAALSIEHSIIWSNDADFDVQKAVRNLKTKDVVSLLSFR